MQDTAILNHPTSIQVMNATEYIQALVRGHKPRAYERSAMQELTYKIVEALSLVGKYPPKKFPKGVWEGGGLTRCAQLTMECWDILHTSEHTPRPGDKDFQANMVQFFYDWEERFTGWHSPQTCVFETKPRIIAMVEFLDRWRKFDLLDNISYERGCDHWLKNNGYIPQDAQTRYDQSLQKTIVIK